MTRSDRIRKGAAQLALVASELHQLELALPLRDPARAKYAAIVAELDAAVTFASTASRSLEAIE